MDSVYTFGYKLAELTKQNESACVGLLCLAIRDAGKDVKQMGYQDYKTVLHTFLPKRLEKIHIDNIDKIILGMEETLSQKQSIFNMSTR